MMSTLWSRARPKLRSYYRRCRCYTCLSHPSHAALRRRPTATLDVSKWSGLTTAFYSSLICTAAVLDAEVKKRRRKGLDIAILKVEHELAAGQRRQAGQLAALSAEAREDDDDVADGVDLGAELPSSIQQGDLLGSEQESRRGGARAPTTTQDTPAAPIFDFGAVLDRRKEVLELIGTSGRRLARSRARNNAPTSIYAEQHIQAKAKTWTPKKLVTLEYSMAKLATKLLLEAEQLHSTQSPSIHYETRFSLRERLQELDLSIRGLSAEKTMELTHTPRLANPHYTTNTEDELETMQNLNSAISTLTIKGIKDELSPRTVAQKVSHNLMVSPVPPSISTMSNLIGGFSRMRQYGMAEAAIEAVFESHMRPDEVAVHAMLVHYLRKNDFGGFHQIFKKMQGFHGGLMLARPSISAEQAGRRIRRWKDKNIQSIEYDSAIYRTLIAGYLRFDRIDLAQSLHDRMSSAGLKPDIALLSEYLAYYTRNGEWSRGLRIWDKLQYRIYPQDMKIRLIRGTQAHMAIRRALQHCKAFHRSNGNEHASIYRRALEHGLPMDALLPGSIPLHHATIHPSITALQRRVRVLKQKAEQHAVDLQIWALQALAARMILAGRSVAQVREMFYQYDNQEAYVEWYTAETMDKERAKQAERACLAQSIINSQEETSRASDHEEQAAPSAEAKDETPMMEELHQVKQRQALVAPSRQTSNRSSVPTSPPAALSPTHRQWILQPSSTEGRTLFPDMPALESAFAG